jgi:hypothetical protein
MRIFICNYTSCSNKRAIDSVSKIERARAPSHDSRAEINAMFSNGTFCTITTRWVGFDRFVDRCDFIYCYIPIHSYLIHTDLFPN